jgi:DNA-binding beta-propeller fold protein YncE
VSSDSTKKKSVLNYHIQYRILILFLISVTLISSSLYLSPLAYSQELYYISSWSQFGREETSLSSPAGIAVDSSSGNVYVADTANNRISAFTSRSPISNVSFSSKDGEIYMVMTQG